MLTRRDFVRMMGILGAAAFAPLDRLIQRMYPDLTEAKTPPGGELYAGLLLLPQDAPLPPIVECAPAPILCMVHDERDPVVIAHRGETISFDNAQDLIGSVSFPIYLPARLPANMAFIGGSILRFAESQRVFEARMDFGLADSRQPLVSVSARPLFPRPYPVWPVHAPPFYKSQMRPAQDDVTIAPEKVGFTPAPGVLLPTAEGHMLQWIRQDVLYTLVVEHDQRRDAVEHMAKSLVEV